MPTTSAADFLSIDSDPEKCKQEGKVATDDENSGLEIDDHEIEAVGAVRTLSRIATGTSTADTCPVPDGGLTAWTQVATSHIVVINTWGTINSFGVFQTYCVSSLSRPPSDISWIGSMQVFFLFFIGALTGRLTDAGYFKQVLLIGSFLVVFGGFMSSLCTTYWQLLLSQGICIGLGMGCLFCPVIAVLSTYFSKRRNLAIGLLISGSATGGVIFPLMAKQLLDKIGFAWTMRCIAFVKLATLMVVNVFAKVRVRPRGVGPIVECRHGQKYRIVFFRAFVVSGVC
jgi:MFS family permease